MNPTFRFLTCYENYYFFFKFVIEKVSIVDFIKSLRHMRLRK